MEALLEVSRAPLGETLLRDHLVTETQIAHALSLQRKSGGRIGDILLAEGAIGPLELYRRVAQQHGLPFVDLLAHPPESHLLQRADADMCLQLRCVPWKREPGKTVVATCELTDEVRAWVRKRFGNATFVITSPLDIRRTIETLFGKSLEAESRLSLWESKPDASARVTLFPRHKELISGVMLIATCIIGFYPIATALALLMFCHVAYAATMLFKSAIFVTGCNTPNMQDWKQSLAALDEHKLPVYTVLIPMYSEASSLPGMMDAMQRMDYPPAKLDIKLVLEADDHETLNAAYKLKPSYQFDIIRVPPSNPRTKPKACNYALRFARGEIVTIFDADDRPERTQLKKAVIAFSRMPRDVVCLQSRLNYYNANDNWLTRFFSLEYTILFHFMLCGLEKIGIPIPLGGTSNHIHLKRLRSLGDWDPYNVTEDADLGARIAARGYRTAMLDSFTMEESPNQLMAWIRQRSRWIKGYMQTWLVHMRHPVKLYRTLGFRGFVGFQFFVGFSSFTFLTAPLVWLLSLLWVGKVALLHSVAFPTWLWALTLTNLALNLFTHWYCALYCALMYRKHLPAMVGAAAFYPLYLIFHSIASYKALWQLIVKPHFWEKTSHGLAHHAPLVGAEGELLRARTA